LASTPPTRHPCASRHGHANPLRPSHAPAAVPTYAAAHGQRQSQRPKASGEDRTCRDTAPAASCVSSNLVCTGDKGARSLFVPVPHCIALPKRRRGITAPPLGLLNHGRSRSRGTLASDANRPLSLHVCTLLLLPCHGTRQPSLTPSLRHHVKSRQRPPRLICTKSRSTLELCELQASCGDLVFLERVRAAIPRVTTPLRNQHWR